MYKKEDPQNVANYRPVTLLPAIGMIFEQSLCNQLRDKFENIFNNSISAYRKHYSREKILIRVVEDWKCERDIDETVAILSSDMSKVFNSMHPKLKAYGFSESALNLMKSYFGKRENWSRVGMATSSWREIKRGCPQGSSLGPMEYLPEWSVLSISDSHLSVYADDHQLYYASKDPDQAVMVKPYPSLSIGPLREGSHAQKGYLLLASAKYEE